MEATASLHDTPEALARRKPMRPEANIKKNEYQIDVHADNVAKVLNDRFATQVIDWTLKERVDQGAVSEFRWGAEEKELLEKIFSHPKEVGFELPMRDSKFRKFVYSIINNGLNSTDVALFQKFKYRLPLKALGLAHDISDFNFKKEIHHSSLNSKVALQSGYYMLEATLKPREYSARIKFDSTASYIKGGGTDHYALRVQSGVMTKRLLWLKTDARLSFNIDLPVDRLINKADITHFRIVRLTRNFFLSRLYKKLGLSFDLNRAPRLSETQFAEQWQRYDRLFHPSHMHLASNQRAGVKPTPSRVSSPNAQLQEILRLLARQR
jgi:hypothetical protein